MKRKRVAILDELTESCRLMPTYMQTILFGSMAGIASLIVPILLEGFVYVIIFIQIVFIILLIQKNIVFRKISKLSVAIKRRVLWVHTKEDRKDLIKKRLINLLLIGITVVLYLKLTSLELLIINSLFCLLFSLKILFFVPLLSIRVIDENGKIFQIINENNQESIETPIYKIQTINFENEAIIIKTIEGEINYKINFSSDTERKRLTKFLTSVYEIKDKFY